MHKTLADIKLEMQYIIYPFKQLYKYGPKSLGFWAGDEESDVCAELSGVGSVFWKHNMAQCSHIISKHWHSKVVVVHSMCYALILFYVLKFTIMYLLFHIYDTRHLLLL